VELLRFLIAWANVPFTVAGAIAVVFSLLQLTGVLGLLAGDGDDADGDGDADHDADADPTHAGFFDALFAGLGVGRVPFSLIWQSYAIVFAITGLALNVRFLGGEPPLFTLLWTLPAGLVSGYAVVALLSRTLAPVLATTTHEATSRDELVGLSGVVISSKVDGDFGEVRIRDKSGHDLRVICRLAPGATEIPERTRVVVVDVDDGRPLVAPLDGADEPPERAERA
jgi:hypothetical protein